MSLGTGVGRLALEGLGPGDERHLDGDLDLEYVDGVASLAELGHGAGDDLGLDLRVGERLLVAAVGVVADEFEEEGDVMGEALVADALDPGLLEVAPMWDFLEGGVVEEDLDAIGSGFLQGGGPTRRRGGQVGDRGSWRRSRFSRRRAGRPALLRILEAGKPNSGSSRMAEA